MQRIDGLTTAVASPPTPACSEGGGDHSVTQRVSLRCLGPAVTESGASRSPAKSVNAANFHSGVRIHALSKQARPCMPQVMEPLPSEPNGAGRDCSRPGDERTHCSHRALVASAEMRRACRGLRAKRWSAPATTLETARASAAPPPAEFTEDIDAGWVRPDAQDPVRRAAMRLIILSRRPPHMGSAVKGGRRAAGKSRGRGKIYSTTSLAGVPNVSNVSQTEPI